MAAERAAQRHIDTWLASLGSANTRAAYRADLAAFVGWCQRTQQPVLRATQETVGRFRADLIATGASAATANRRASAVHSFLRSRRPDGDQRAGTADGASTTAALSPRDRANLLDVLPEQSSKAQVLVAMLLLDGLKLDEVLAFDADDVGGELPQLDVSVERDDVTQPLALHPTTSQIVSAHLAARTSGPLLDGRGGQGTRMTRFGADYLVKQAGRDARIDVALTTNMLRRSYVTEAHASGEGLEQIRWQVGHDDVRTTRRYLPNTGRR